MVPSLQFICAASLLVLSIAALLPLIRYAAEVKLRSAVSEAQRESSAKTRSSFPPGDYLLNQDAEIEDRRMSAFARLGFAFALTTGTQWLASLVRQAIFQEYVGILEEADAKMYSLYMTIPIVLFYNYAISATRPQKLVQLLCYIYGTLLICLSLYVAYLDGNGGKYGLFAFDGEDGTTIFSERWRERVLYFLVIVIETRSVVLYGSLMSFLSLYLGARSKNLSASVFTFVNFFQQIGMIVFLLSGAGVHYLQIPLSSASGDPSRINGGTFLLFVIAICTLLLPTVVNPAYDALEELKVAEEADDDMPESAKLGSLQTQSNEKKLESDDEEAALLLSSQESVSSREETPGELRSKQAAQRLRRIKKSSFEISPSNSTKTVVIAEESGLSLLKRTLWTCVEGLALLLSHKFIFLLFIVQYAHLPLKQMIEIQMGFLLGQMKHDGPDSGLELQASQSTKSDDKTGLLTRLGLVAGVLNAALNWYLSKDVVRKWGNRAGLLTNPFLAGLCLLAFCGSYLVTERNGYASIQFAGNAEKTSAFCLFGTCGDSDNWHACPYTKIPWNDAAFKGEGAVHALEGPDQFLCTLASGTGIDLRISDKDGKCSADASMLKPLGSSDTKKILVFNWKDNLAVEKGNVELFGKQGTPLFQAFVPKRGKTANEFKTGLAKDSVSSSVSQETCKAICVENWRECKYMFFSEEHCTLFTKRPQSFANPDTYKIMGAKAGATSSVIRGRFSFAQIARSAQTALGKTVSNHGLVFVVERRVDVVEDDVKDSELNILTAVIERKEYEKRGGSVAGLKRTSPSSDLSLMSVDTRYFFVAAFWVLWSAATLAICNPIINVVTLRTAPKVKVKAKSWSNSFGNNVLKMIGNLANGLNVPIFSLLFTMGFGVSWIGVWIVCVFLLTTMHDRLENDNEYVGAEENVRE